MILRLEDIPETELLLGSAMDSHAWALNAETVSEIDAQLLDLSTSKEDTEVSNFASLSDNEYD